MGAYAVPDNRRFISSKPISRKRRLTDEQKEWNEFMDSHNIDFYIDESGEGAVRITEKNTGSDKNEQ